MVASLYCGSLERLHEVRETTIPDDTGCGIACVAMLTRKPYMDVKQLMINENIFDTNLDFGGTSFNDIKHILNKLNIHTARKRKFKRWQDIPANIAIASTNYDKEGLWHWVVFIRDIEGFYIN